VAEWLGRQPNMPEGAGSILGGDREMAEIWKLAQRQRRHQQTPWRLTGNNTSNGTTASASTSSSTKQPKCPLWYVAEDGAVRAGKKLRH